MDESLDWDLLINLLILVASVVLGRPLHQALRDYALMVRVRKQSEAACALQAQVQRIVLGVEEYAASEKKQGRPLDSETKANLARAQVRMSCGMEAAPDGEVNHLIEQALGATRSVGASGELGLA